MKPRTVSQPASVTLQDSTERFLESKFNKTFPHDTLSYNSVIKLSSPILDRLDERYKTLRDLPRNAAEEPLRYLGGLKTQTKKLSKLAKMLIRECADDPQYDNVVKVWVVIDTLCKQKRYTPEQVGKFLRHYKKKLIREELKEKLDSAHVNEHSLNVPDVPISLTTKTNTLKKSAKKTRNRQELVSGGFF